MLRYFSIPLRLQFHRFPFYSLVFLKSYCIFLPFIFRHSQRLFLCCRPIVKEHLRPPFRCSCVTHSPSPTEPTKSFVQKLIVTYTLYSKSTLIVSFFFNGYFSFASVRCFWSRRRFFIVRQKTCLHIHVCACSTEPFASVYGLTFFCFVSQMQRKKKKKTKIFLFYDRSFVLYSFVRSHLRFFFSLVEFISLEKHS